MNFTVSLLLWFMSESDRGNFSEHFTKLWNTAFNHMEKYKFQFIENFRPRLPRRENTGSFPKSTWILCTHHILNYVKQMTQNTSTALFFHSFYSLDIVFMQVIYWQYNSWPPDFFYVTKNIFVHSFIHSFNKHWTENYNGLGGPELRYGTPWIRQKRFLPSHSFYSSGGRQALIRWTDN